MGVAQDILWSLTWLSTFVFMILMLKENLYVDIGAA